jgi:hypothetical protein
MAFAMPVPLATPAITNQMKFKGWRIPWPQMQLRRSRQLPRHVTARMQQRWDDWTSGTHSLRRKLSVGNVDAICVEGPFLHAFSFTESNLGQV